MQKKCQPRNLALKLLEIFPTSGASGAVACAVCRDTIVLGAMFRIVHSTVPYPTLKEPETPRMLSDAGVGPEIYLSGATLDAITPDEAKTVAETLRRAGVRSLSFHAPFEDVWPGARDEEARRFAVRRIAGAIALAPPLYRATAGAGRQDVCGPSEKDRRGGGKIRCWICPPFCAAIHRADKYKFR